MPKRRIREPMKLNSAEGSRRRRKKGEFHGVPADELCTLPCGRVVHAETELIVFEVIQDLMKEGMTGREAVESILCRGVPAGYRLEGDNLVEVKSEQAALSPFRIQRAVAKAMFEMLGK